MAREKTPHIKSKPGCAFKPGQRVGYRRIRGFTPGTRQQPGLWTVECRCGAVQQLHATAVRRTKQCRSCSIAKQTTHGQARKKATTLEYRRWRLMHVRCGSKPGTRSYAWYGGKGIKVCRRWQGPNGFANFFADMGKCPPGRWLDRLNGNKGYSPSNCRWGTIDESTSNKSSNHYLVFRGKRKTMGQWAKLKNIPAGTIFGRIARGWSVERTLTTPALLQPLQSEIRFLKKELRKLGWKDPRR